jgi:protein tyrosine/serine phosphatase
MERKLLDTYLENNVVNFSDNTKTIFAIVDGNKLTQNKYQIELSNGVNVNLLILNVNKEITFLN